MNEQPSTSGQKAPASEFRSPIAALWAWASWDRTKDVILVITPVLIVILGGLQWFFVHQQNIIKATIDQRVGHVDMIAKMLSDIHTMVEKSALQPEFKSRILISLMKITTTSRISKEGESDRKLEELITKIPLYFALLSKDHAMLADIGADEIEIDLWVPFASGSGDRNIKMTAIKTLEEILLASNNDAVSLQKKVAGIYLEKTQFNVDDRDVRELLIRGIDTAINKLGGSTGKANTVLIKDGESTDGKIDKGEKQISADNISLIGRLNDLKTSLRRDEAAELLAGVGRVSSDADNPAKAMWPDNDAALRSERAESFVNTLRPPQPSSAENIALLISRFRPSRRSAEKLE